MLFNEFAHSLHEYVKPKIGVVPFINNLMGNCLPITLYAKIANTTAYRYYNKGISSIYAKEIYNCIQCDKLKEYIEKATQAITNKEEIVDTFKSEIVDLSIDNYPERLAKLLETIIIEVAESEDNKEAKQDTYEETEKAEEAEQVSHEETEEIKGAEQVSDEETEEIEGAEQVTREELDAIPHTVLRLIYDLILEVLMSMKTLECDGIGIADYVLQYSESEIKLYSKEWKQYNQNYQDYKKLNAKLHTFFERYPCKLFNPALKIRPEYTIDEFWKYNILNEFQRLVSDMRYTSEYYYILKDITIDLEKYFGK